eukprot:Colp12_sorted_trinity150504_noHs@20888
MDQERGSRFSDLARKVMTPQSLRYLLLLIPVAVILMVIQSRANAMSSVIDVQVEYNDQDSPQGIVWTSQRASLDLPQCRRCDFKNVDFRHIGSADRKTWKFVSSNLDKVCNMEFYTPELFVQALPTKPVWVSFIGDSLLRGPYTTVVERLTHRRIIVNMTAETYHLDHILCCRDREDPTSCALERIERNSPDTSALLTNRVLEYYPNSVCVSWEWNTHIDDHLMQKLSNISMAKIAPRVIVVNPGLHLLLTRVPTAQIHNSITLFRSIVLLFRQLHPETTFLYQSATPTVYEKLKPHKRQALTNARIGDLNEATNLLLEGSQVIMSDVFKYCQKPYVTNTTGDGIHYDVPYRELVIQSAFNVVVKGPSAYCERS